MSSRIKTTGVVRAGADHHAAKVHVHGTAHAVAAAEQLLLQGHRRSGDGYRGCGATSSSWSRPTRCSSMKRGSPNTRRRLVSAHRSIRRCPRLPGQQVRSLAGALLQQEFDVLFRSRQTLHVVVRESRENVLANEGMNAQPCFRVQGIRRLRSGPGEEDEHKKSALVGA